MLRAAVLLLGCLAVGSACGGPSDAATGSPGPAVVGLRVTPHTTSLRAGETVQFDAVQQLSDGSSTHVRPQFRATGGSISSSGLFTAGTSPGTFTVIAFDANTQLADTAIVTVLAPSQQPPPTGYARVVGDDWQGYGSNAALFARQYFYWVDATGRNVNDFVTLVSDPTFGKAVRITFPQNTGGPGSSPRLAADLPAPLDRMWFRWRMKFTPGWTTVGPDPAGSANSYKIAFWGWKNYYGRGELEYSNTTDYVLGTGVQDREPEGVADSFKVDVGKVYCWTKVTGPEGGGEITHAWYKGGEKMSDVKLALKFKSVRTWSYKTIPADGQGAWRVDVLAPDGTVLKSIEFKVE